MRKKDPRSKKQAHERNADCKSSRRFRLREDEVSVLEEYRRISSEAEKAGLNPDTVKSGWLKSEESSLYFKNPNYKTPEQIGIEKMSAELLKEFKNYAPKYPTIKRKKKQRFAFASY